MIKNVIWDIYIFSNTQQILQQPSIVFFSYITIESHRKKSDKNK